MDLEPSPRVILKRRVTTKADLTEEVEKPGQDCAYLESKRRKGEVFRHGMRLATVHRPSLSKNGQDYANATRCAQAIFQASSDCRLSRGGIGRRIMEDFLDCLSGFARDLGDLPHQVGAERKHNICQTRDVGQEGVSVFPNEAAIA
jgi:hypothetical protein